MKCKQYYFRKREYIVIGVAESKEAAMRLVRQIIEECMEQGNYEEKTSSVYQCYRSWCLENGHYAESMRNFKQSLEAIIPVVRKRPKAGGEKTTMVTGYRLLPDFLK